MSPQAKAFISTRIEDYNESRVLVVECHPSRSAIYVKDGQDEVNTRNSLVVCDFLPFGFDRLALILNAMTGLNTTADDLQAAGERISTLHRMYNIKNGRTRSGDTLPQRFFKEKHLAGIFKDKHLTEEEFGKWLDPHRRKISPTQSHPSLTHHP